MLAQNVCTVLPGEVEQGSDYADRSEQFTYSTNCSPIHPSIGLSTGEDQTEVNIRGWDRKRKQNGSVKKRSPAFDSQIQLACGLSRT